MRAPELSRQPMACLAFRQCVGAIGIIGWSSSSGFSLVRFSFNYKSHLRVPDGIRSAIGGYLKRLRGPIPLRMPNFRKDTSDWFAGARFAHWRPISASTPSRAEAIQAKPTGRRLIKRSAWETAQREGPKALARNIDPRPCSPARTKASVYMFNKGLCHIDLL